MSDWQVTIDTMKPWRWDWKIEQGEHVWHGGSARTRAGALRKARRYARQFDAGVRRITESTWTGDLFPPEERTPTYSTTQRRGQVSVPNPPPKPVPQAQAPTPPPPPRRVCDDDACPGIHRSDTT